MKLETLQAINRARSARQPALLITRLRDGAQQFWLIDAQFVADSLPEIREVMRKGESAVCEQSGEQIFVSLFLPPPRLVIIGAGHIAQHLYPMIQAIGWDVIILDPRSAFASPARFPEVDIFPSWPSEILGQFELDRFSAVVVLSHDAAIDDEALEIGLNAGCFYIGALGSQRSHQARRQRLADKGVSPAQLDRIHAPVGLDIGARGSAEIAVAIAAQLISVWQTQRTDIPHGPGAGSRHKTRAET